VTKKSGKDHLHKKKLQKELSDLNKAARKLKVRWNAGVVADAATILNELLKRDHMFSRQIHARSTP